jgi:hypothetical protein
MKNSQIKYSGLLPIVTLTLLPLLYLYSVHFEESVQEEKFRVLNTLYRPNNTSKVVYIDFALKEKELKRSIIEQIDTNDCNMLNGDCFFTAKTIFKESDTLYFPVSYYRLFDGSIPPSITCYYYYNNVFLTLNWFNEILINETPTAFDDIEKTIQMNLPKNEPGFHLHLKYHDLSDIERRKKIIYTTFLAYEHIFQEVEKIRGIQINKYTFTEEHKSLFPKFRYVKRVERVAPPPWIK